MGKVRQWISHAFERWIERSMQRHANKLFDKSQVKHRDGDNT